MDADFSIELGRDDPALDFPWTDPDGKLAYFDLKRHPEYLAQVEEAKQFPELAEFLRAINSAMSMVESVKCDAWFTTDLSPEEGVFRASHKFASYVDLVFSAIDHRQSLPFHELFAQRLVELLRRTPETPSAAEVCVRRCFYHGVEPSEEGFYFTLYENGYGRDETRARRNWGIGLKLLGNAILQLSAAGLE